MITDSITIHAPAADVYAALVRPALIQQWFSDEAFLQFQARVGGAYYLGWNLGYRVTGTFTALEPNTRVAMTWRGDGEERETQVEYSLTAVDGGTYVTITHNGHSDSERGKQEEANHRRGWEGVLEALKHLVENGTDLRFMRRPMLGIFLDEVTPARRAEVHLPDDVNGVWIVGTVENSGARAAGLERGDVVVSIAGTPVNDFASIGAALKGKVGGDMVDVAYYRAGVRYEKPMQLTKRQPPAVPPTPAGLAAHLRDVNSRLMEEIAALTAGVPEELLARRPGADEWSVNENLAHLIWTERIHQVDVWNAVSAGIGVEWLDNNPAHLTPTLAKYRTGAALLDALREELMATAAQVEALPADAAARATTFIGLGATLLAGEGHMRDHIEQMTRALEAVKATV